MPNIKKWIKHPRVLKFFRNTSIALSITKVAVNAFIFFWPHSTPIKSPQLNPTTSYEQQGGVTAGTFEENSATSYQQQGGITAGKITIINAPIQRVLDAATKKEMVNILKELSPDKSALISIRYAFQGADTYPLANEIKLFLESEGWKTEEMAAKVFRTPIFDVDIDKTPEGKIEISVGSR